jgi:MarR family transcriptional regulator, organic hydroperoxide resistance regulator
MPDRLQAELKQSKPFPSPMAEALLSILRTAAVIDHHLAEVLKPFGITGTQYNVLRILRGAGQKGLCGREVAERLVSKVPDVSRLLDRTEDLGLIRRERDPEDRRHVTARITDKGLAVLEKSTPALEAIQRRRLGRLDPEGLQQLIAALEDVRSGI